MTNDHPAHPDYGDLIGAANEHSRGLGDLSADRPITLGEHAVSVRLPNSDGTDQRLTLDGEPYQPHPRRSIGLVKVTGADSFVAAIKDRTEPGGPCRIYASVTDAQLVAVLNDDTRDAAGWRDDRIQLDLPATPAWTHWTTNQGAHEQQKFAEIIEDGADDIVDPAAAVMLQIAQTFHATIDSKAKAGHRLSNGAQQLVWEENVEAKAGPAGTIEIPTEFTLGLRPFDGATRYEVTARLRYRFQRSEFAVGYKLHRPEAVLTAAFTDVVKSVREQLGDDYLILDGKPAGTR